MYRVLLLALLVSHQLFILQQSLAAILVCADNTMDHGALKDRQLLSRAKRCNFNYDVTTVKIMTL